MQDLGIEAGIALDREARDGEGFAGRQCRPSSTR
jgi:hypothetical protein